MIIKMLKKKKKDSLGPFAILFACLIYLFLYLPIVIIVLYSFNTSDINVNFEGFTLDWYISVFQGSDLMDSLVVSLKLGLYATLLSVAVGTIATIGMHRYEFKTKKVINNLLYIPIVIPEIVIGIAFLASFSFIGVRMNMITLVISHATFCIPFVIITLRARIAGFDSAIEEAAMDLGANQWRTLRRVTIPMLAPGIVAGALLSFTLSIDDVVISFFAAGPAETTLPIRIYGMARGKISPDVYALSTLIILVTLVIYLTAQLLQNRFEKTRG